MHENATSAFSCNEKRFPWLLSNQHADTRVSLPRLLLLPT